MMTNISPTCQYNLGLIIFHRWQNMTVNYNTLKDFTNENDNQAPNLENQSRKDAFYTIVMQSNFEVIQNSKHKDLYSIRD